MILQAQTISSLVRSQLSCGRMSGSVHSVFGRSVNLLCGGSVWISLHAPGVPLHPYAVVLQPDGVRGDRSAFLASMVGESVETKDGEIVLGQGRLSVRLEGAAVWYPRLKPIVGDGQGDATALVWAIHDALEGEKITSLFLRKTGDAEGLEGVFADRCRLVAEDLRQAWRLGDAQTVALAIQSAVGLGSGLTPSGDDFVVGFLGAAQCFAYGSEVEGGVRRSLSLDKSMTTLPSYFMLRGALAGFLPEPLTDLLHAVGRRSRRRILYSVRRLAGLGASSGQDMLAGVVCYLEAAGTVGVTG